MRIVHWTLTNGSGMNMVAVDMSEGEKALGHDSVVLSSFNSAEWPKGMGADIHVSHSHVPDPVRKAGGKLVWVGHGTPEHCFEITSQEMTYKGYAPSDTMALVGWWLQHADAIVTFWPRHAHIWSTMCDKRTIVDCVPLGVNKEFWKPNSRGKFVGAPSVFSTENCHRIKWPLDLIIMWGWVTDELPNAQLHINYLPRDQHRYWFPLMYRTGASFKSYVSGNSFGKEDLRNAFSSVDYVTSFVQYGDFNRITLEAKACGAKLISWAGNPYADYWILEGNQILQKEQMIKILKGEVQAREVEQVPDILDTAKAMIEIYERVLNE